MMNTRKRRPGAVGTGETQSFLDQLFAEGVDLGEDAEISDCGQEACSLEITPASYSGIICDFPPLNVGLAIPVSIGAVRQTTLVDCFIESPWDWTIGVADLREHNGRYHLGSLSNPIASYPSAEVLNDHFVSPFSLRRGQTIEGVILAYGCVSMPDEIRSRVVPVQVIVIDSWQREARSTIYLPLRRVPNPLADLTCGGVHARVLNSCNALYDASKAGA